MPQTVLSPAGLPITVVPVVVSTVIALVLATIVYSLLNRFTSNPNRWFTIIAVVVLVVSAVSPLGLPGAPTMMIVMLEVMHVVAAVAAVYFCGSRRRKKNGGTRLGGPCAPVLYSKKISTWSPFSLSMTSTMRPRVPPAIASRSFWTSTFEFGGMKRRPKSTRLRGMFDVDLGLTGRAVGDSARRRRVAQASGLGGRPGIAAVGGAAIGSAGPPWPEP